MTRESKWWLRLALAVVGYWLLVYLALAAAPALAQAVAPDAARVTWTNATELVTGAPIPASGPESIVTNRVQRALCGTGDAFGSVQETLNVPSTVNALLFENLPPGRYCFRARHVQENGGLSDWSAIARKTIEVPAPALPKRPLSISIE